MHCLNKMRWGLDELSDKVLRDSRSYLKDPLRGFRVFLRTVLRVFMLLVTIFCAKMRGFRLLNKYFDAYGFLLLKR